MRRVTSAALEIPLEKHGDVYTLPVVVNGVITLNFILDSGASEVVIPLNFVTTLLRSGTIIDKDFLLGKSKIGEWIRYTEFQIQDKGIEYPRIQDF